MCHKNDVGRELFIVNQGEVLILDSDVEHGGTEIARLKTGAFFGEIGNIIRIITSSFPRIVTF